MGVSLFALQGRQTWTAANRCVRSGFFSTVGSGREGALMMSASGAGTACWLRESEVLWSCGLLALEWWQILVGCVLEKCRNALLS